jgi:hypothetical protein
MTYLSMGQATNDAMRVVMRTAMSKYLMLTLKKYEQIPDRCAQLPLSTGWIRKPSTQLKKVFAGASHANSAYYYNDKHTTCFTAIFARINIVEPRRH